MMIFFFGESLSDIFRLLFPLLDKCLRCKSPKKLYGRSIPVLELGLIDHIVFTGVYLFDFVLLKKYLIREIPCAASLPICERYSMKSSPTFLVSVTILDSLLEFQSTVLLSFLLLQVMILKSQVRKC